MRIATYRNKEAIRNIKHGLERIEFLIRPIRGERSIDSAATGNVNIATNSVLTSLNEPEVNWDNINIGLKDLGGWVDTLGKQLN